MIVQDTKKIFFWIFGVVFGLLNYLLLKNQYIFSSTESAFIVPAISLIIFILFFIVGIFVSKISQVSYLSITREKDIQKIEDTINTEEKAKKLKQLIKNLRKTLNYVLSKNCSKEAIQVLSDYIGIDKDASEKLIYSFKHLRQIRYIYWSVGVVLSITSIVLIFNLSFFESLRQPLIIPILISLIIFILFFIEGFLIMRMPEKIYIDLLKINEKSKEEQKQKIQNEKEILEIKEKTTQKSVDSIKKAIKYLIKMNGNRSWILELLINNGFSKEASEDIIYQTVKEQEFENKLKIDLASSKATKELFISKIHDDFIILKEIYAEMVSLKSYVSHLEDRQKKMEIFIAKNIKTEKFEKSKISEKDIQKSSVKVVPPLPNSTEIDPSKQVDFLYLIIKPFTYKYTKEETQSILLSLGYTESIIADVFILLEENNIEFRKEKTQNFASTINDFYDEIIGNK
ncbi:MAG: hypothetical protein WCX82_01935 [archaeon]|jgi:hypothetical protein